ncbi:hypothetical protein GGG16DRAFT_43139 [Schizophyllum commune]
MSQDPPPKQESNDLAESIPGLYRILDLINEQGSGGLVDKIIIAQDSLARFINEVCPGAYQSLTKVDFKALDKLTVKPIGIYGSKSEIVKLLETTKVVNRKLSSALLRPKDDSPGRKLRSGLYFVRMTLPSASEEQLFVIYWPEDATWNDNAPSAVCKNRVTFIRFLTKIADQTMCLISPEHAQQMVWKEAAVEDDNVDLDEDADRFFTFEVAKTNEQEEDVAVRPGIRVGTLHRSIRELTFMTSNIDGDILAPHLIAGETTQAFVTTRYVAQKSEVLPIRFQQFNKTQIEYYFTYVSEGSAVYLGDELNAKAIDCLMSCGLRDAFQSPCNRYLQNLHHAKTLIEADFRKEADEVKANVENSKESLRRAVRVAIVDHISSIYPVLQIRLQSMTEAAMENEGEKMKLDGDADERTLLASSFQDLGRLFPGMQQAFDDQMKHDEPENIYRKSIPFHTLKDRLIIASVLMDNPDYGKLDVGKRSDLLATIMRGGELKASLYSEVTKPSKGWIGKAMSKVLGRDTSIEESTKDRAAQLVHRIGDPEFLASLDDLLIRNAAFEPIVTQVIEAAYDYLHGLIQKAERTLTAKLLSIQQTVLLNRLGQAADNERDRQAKVHRQALICEVNDAARPEATYVFQALRMLYRSCRSVVEPVFVAYTVCGHQQRRLAPAIEYTVHPLGVSSGDKQELQLNRMHIPALREETRFSQSFRLPVHYRVRHLQLLGNGKCLLIVDNGHNFHIYLEDLPALAGATANSRIKKTLHQDKIGSDIVFAVDETTRLLALCSTHKLMLYVYSFDEAFAAIRSAHIIDLNRWYPDGTSMHQMCIASGSEEVLLIDNVAQARVFSLITQQFRPATLSLPRLPVTCLTSPDGGCLILMFKDTDDSPPATRAYHWSTFGSAEGIALDLPSAKDSAITTSIVNRSIVHLAWIEPGDKTICSYALDITKKVTEFSFQEKGSKSTARSNAQTLHNSLIECHADVWTRFPVIPAIPRQTVVTDVSRPDRSLVFVSEHHQDRFASHFVEMIQSFEQRTRKPSGKVLRDIRVDAVAFQDVRDGVMPGVEWDSEISRFHLGEWLVDVFCLIPIHIAVTRDNRFVPLKDGVYSMELERALLGADVGQIVDALSLGWYESIFQSYQSTKPVKVVSSMGEQSVGKSFALNHLADTSFAGSAMRTTEGVWMAVTPTDTSLVVALDFEGVHSIERSAQEDMLLVLFNAAISNLVLFRNNFALSRDITDLFQSFQSSSSILDPAANPSLFQSTLVIIIKDVVESDKKEIVKEFRLKLQQIVHQEQDANFISKLHAGRLNIIPWPVIESKQFYAYFVTLKNALDKQALTHPSAGNFLQTLKTLMAKLKSNDWGSIDQTLAAHRAGRLLEVLPIALARGFADAYDDEPLKNLDTSEEIVMPDTDAVLHVAVLADEAVNAEGALEDLKKGWSQFSSRSALAEDLWVAQLSSYLDGIVDQRVDHVHTWLEANLERFKAEHASIDNLRRTFATIGAQMKADVELCKVKCSKCNLLCLRSRRHSSSEPHDCGTSHVCPQYCDYSDEHFDEEAICGLPAGHDGKHICVVERHLCGEPCGLRNKKGCLGDCIKPTGHTEDEHVCAAQIHACGEPCDLVDVTLPDGSMYSCNGTCRIPSHEVHDEHVCDVRMCPLECELCHRLCSNQDHLHALDHDAQHLCGQPHPCPERCTASGICEIDTTPLSVEATFTGRHETFQYTKYCTECAIVAKRLQCAVTIPADKNAHDGPHTHTTAANPFHYCEARCENCGYYCTMPRAGHSQQEHETSHGSMSKTRWALDDQDGTIELNGRKFGADDDGAPMLCNLVCKEMGRHVHVDYCRAPSESACQGEGILHIRERMKPDPDRSKDWISHNLFWKRTAFSDPYSKEDQANFAKCDAMCSGPEHAATTTAPAQPSYCTLPVFHPPQYTQGQGLGYVSNDGHHFSCKNPAVLQQAFHVIFVVDRSGSMSLADRRPLANAPGYDLIRRHCDDRLGAVYSALHSFWIARDAAVSATGPQAARRDAYSMLLFNSSVSTILANDFARSPDQLLQAVVGQTAGGGTNYTAALSATEALLRQHWSTERTPVVIFLSDGECSVGDHSMHALCQAAVQLGKHLSFHSVSFGPSNEVLRRMAQIARDVQARAPRDPALPATAYVESSYAEALDSVRLAETFLGLADSLRKPRGALLR